MNNNILIVSLIIIVILLVVAVNMLSDMYLNKPKKLEKFANIADDPSGTKLNTFLNKNNNSNNSNAQSKEQYHNNPFDTELVAADIAKKYCPVPPGFDMTQYERKTETQQPDNANADNNTHNMDDYVLKSSLPPENKCPSCICPKVSVLAGIDGDSCPPCPVQRCPPCPTPEPPKAPECPPMPEVICPTPEPIYVRLDDNGDLPNPNQNVLDYLRKALEEPDNNQYIQDALGVLLGKQMNSDGATEVQKVIDSGTVVDQKPKKPPNQAVVENFVNAPKTFTADGRLI